MKFLKSRNIYRVNNSSSIPYQREIDGLRGIGILMVMLTHSWSYFSAGYLGVDIFFVISGYLITKILLVRDEPLSKFYFRRFARLYPALLAMNLLVFILSFLNLIKVNVIGYLLSLTYTMSFAGFFTPNDNIYGPLTPTWSLSIEEIFYLIWPILLIIFLRRISKVKLSLLLLIFLFIIFILQRETYSQISPTIFSHSPIFRASSVIFGCIVALNPITIKKIYSLLLYPVILVFTTISVFRSNTMYISLATALVLILLNQKYNSLIKVLLKFPPLGYLGRRSYSVYLYNLIFITLFKEDRLSLFGWITLLLFISELSYRYVERKGQKILLGWYNAKYN